MNESGFAINYYTLDAFLGAYAKEGNIDSIKATFERYKKLNIDLLNRDILRTMIELASNGFEEKIESLLPYLHTSMELKRSLRSAISMAVENNQPTAIVHILKSSDVDVATNAKYLIEEMVRRSVSVEQFEKTWQSLESIGLTIEKNFYVFKPALEAQSEEMIKRILLHMKSQSMPINENLFSKLFKLTGEKGVEHALDTVNLMCSEFNIQPQITFIRDVILPEIKANENVEYALAKLRSTKLRIRSVVIAIVNTCLNGGDIATAYRIAENNKSYFALDLIKKPLIKAYAMTEDTENFVAFIRLMYDSIRQSSSHYHSSKTLTETDIDNEQKQFVGEFIRMAVSNDVIRTKYIVSLLEAIAAHGFSITVEQVDSITKLLKVDTESEVGTLLQKLGSKKLDLKPIRPQGLRQNDLKMLSSIEIGNILEVKIAQGGSSSTTHKHLFLAYLREGNVAEIESLLATTQFSISNSDYALLIELYTRTKNLDRALETLKLVCANNQMFRLDHIKVMKLVDLMVEKERSFTEIEKILVYNRKEKSEQRIFVLEHLLDRLAATGNAETIKRLFETSIENNYVKPSTDLLGPLISVHLKKGDFSEAVSVYEQIVSGYKLVPMTMTLFKSLIKHNELDLLQRAFDIYEMERGEEAALYRLAFAFNECDQDRQANLIFDNERLKNVSKYIKSECKSYVKFNRLDALKSLLKSTKGLFCDRHIIYQSILDIYCKQNKPESALELYGEYSSESGLIENPIFLRRLARLLQTNNMDVPFEIRSDSKASIESDKDLHEEKALN